MISLDIPAILRETFVARVEHYPTVGSTNDVAKHRATEGFAPLPLLVVADSQTAGRGRGSNRWWTGTGSLAFSLLMDVRPWSIPPAHQPMIALATGVAVVEAVKPCLPDRVVGICWPNDVFAGGRKLAGVLIEVPIPNKHVIGIGINTNCSLQEAPPELHATAATILDMTGDRQDHTEILVRLLRQFASLLSQLAGDSAEVARRADALCLQHGRELTLDIGTHSTSGICRGIALDGALLLETAGGCQSFHSGAVRY